MFCVRSVAAALVSAASFACCVCASAGSARASDDATVLLFSGVDLWRDGQFMHGGLIWSPGGLDRVLSWYDNEWGFSTRMADVTAAMAKFL